MNGAADKPEPGGARPEAPRGARVTSLDVARRAGVSQSAVSRAFTEGASVAPETRERVKEAAQALGYRPNALARSVITGRSRLVGVVMAYLENQFYPRVLEALGERLNAHGYQILLFTGFKDRDSDPVLEQILPYRVDGLFLASTTLSSALAEECAAVGVPVVLFNRTDQGGHVSSVTSDNHAGGRRAAAFLAVGGHRRFAYLAGTANSSTNRDREAGFAAGLEEHGIDEFARVAGHYSAEHAAEAVRRLLSRPDRPDALFCANDHMAIAAIDVARHELGLAVPDDVSIIGYDDTLPAGWPAYAITTVSQPIEPMVASAVDILLEQFADPAASPRHVVVDGELVVRGSARLPPSGLRDEGGRTIWTGPV